VKHECAVISRSGFSDVAVCKDKILSEVAYLVGVETIRLKAVSKLVANGFNGVQRPMRFPFIDSNQGTKINFGFDEPNGPLMPNFSAAIWLRVGV
jgi:hypothetical protein